MKTLLGALIFLSASIAFGQHEHHHEEMPRQDSLVHTDHSDHTMTHAFSLVLPMNRNGSGTGWLPDETPMYAWMKGNDRWSYMMHGAIFFRQSFQNLNNDYKYGGKSFDVPNWVMGMAQYKTRHKGLFLFRAMMSLDPVTTGGNGYPLLFQTGETYKGVPLVNRQHPHDLFSELSVGYTQRFNNGLDVSFYLAYPGEPAIGPTAFMHRISSLNNPNAPLSHHLQDATHITFGVATAGIRYRKFKLEASSFTGREPNEERYGFDKPRFDSYSYRLSYAPSKNFVFQASRAFINNPEEHHEEVVKRTTFSLSYAKRFSQESHLTGAMIVGLNRSPGGYEFNSTLIELNYQIKKVAVYGRLESAMKSPEELQVNVGGAQISIEGLTLGANYQLGSWFATNTAIGVQGTINNIPGELYHLYGKNPISAEAYLRIVPAIMKHTR